MRILRVELNQNVNFGVQRFLQDLLFEKIFLQNCASQKYFLPSNSFFFKKKFFFKIRRIAKFFNSEPNTLHFFSIQILTRCEKFSNQIGRVVEILFQNLTP